MYFKGLKSGHFKRCSLSQISSLLSNFTPERGRGCKTTLASSISCLFQIRVEDDIQWCKIVLHTPDPVALGRPFGLFHLAAGIPHRRQKGSPTIILWWKALAMWMNKYNWFKLVMSPEKKALSWNRTSWCILRSFLNSAPFSKVLQSSDWKIYISNKKKYSWFVLFRQISFYLFHRF